MQVLQIKVDQHLNLEENHTSNNYYSMSFSCSFLSIKLPMLIFRDQILARITEQERLSVKYKDEEREIQKQKLDLAAQAKMWNDIQKYKFKYYLL